MMILFLFQLFFYFFYTRKNIFVLKSNIAGKSSA